VVIEKDSPEHDLRHYVEVLSRRRLVALLTVAVVVGLAMLVSYLEEPLYAAKARILMQTRGEETPFDPSTGQRADPDRALATEIEVLRGQGVREEVRQKLGSAPPVTAAAVGTTDVIEVTARNTDPRWAAEVANAYATSFIDFKRKRAVDDLLAAAREIQASVNEIQRQIDALDAQVAAALSAGQQAARESVTPQKTALVQQVGLFKQTLDQLQVSARLRTGGAQLVGAAGVPGSPVSPKPLRNLVLALVIGATLAIAVALLSEHLDDSIESEQDLERLTGSVPVIAVIPMVRGWKARDRPRIISLEDTRAPASEAYRTLRTAVEFLALDRPMSIVQVTSPKPSEGKSTTLANLAVTLATAGRQVIVVCCDLRRPRIHEFFGLPNEVGVTSVLLGRHPIMDALQPVDGLPTLRLMASGPLPPYPSELLSSSRMTALFARLRSEADIVLIDSPPILPVSDALVMFRRVDATLMVFSARSTNRKEAMMALAKARQVDVPLVGAVLNGVSSRSGAQYGYGYGYEQTGNGNGSSSSKGPLPASSGARPLLGNSSAGVAFTWASATERAPDDK
jgi:succinoglycan biosynthesis transport protein ExoP